jgi:membrane protein DedA with SNARE-associated domain
MLEYIAIVIGLIAFGDVAFITATYFALFGYLDLSLIILLSFLVSNIMGMFWYQLSQHGLGGFLHSFSFIKKYEKNHPQMMEKFLKHQLKILFLSRFLYGSGTVIMILSGIYKVPFKKYVLVNLLSSIIVIIGVPIIVLLAKTSTMVVFDNIRMIEWLVASFVLIIFLSIRFELGSVINKILFPRKKSK